MGSANWIKDATKNKGAFTAKAKKAGAITEKGTIKKEFITKSTKSKDIKTKREALLAMTLGKLRNK